MSEVANAFSDFATLPTPKLVESDLVKITRRSLEIFDGVDVKFNSSHEEIYLQLDRTQWIRVFTILIQNGIQASKQGRIPKIDVTIIKEVKSVKIKFIDNGKGIPESIQSKVFEPKFTTKTKGMGLGLGIVKNIVNSHNGSIKYETGKKGTIFIITLSL